MAKTKSEILQKYNKLIDIEKGMKFDIDSIAMGGLGAIECHDIIGKHSILHIYPYQFEQLRRYIDRGYTYAMSNTPQLNWRYPNEQKNFETLYFDLHRLGQLHVE